MDRKRRLGGITLLVVLALSGQAHAQDEAPTPPIVQRIDSLKLEARFDEATALAGEYVASVHANPEAKPYEIVDAELLLRTLVYIDSLPRPAQEEIARAEGLSDSLTAYFLRGEYRPALEMGRELVDIYRRHLGENSREFGQGINDLGAMLHFDGDYVAAEALYRRSIAIFRVVLGDEHPLIANSLNNLAYLLYNEGDYVGAEPLAREALAMFRDTLGSEATIIAFCMDNLARILTAQGNYAEAETLIREALAMNRKLLGERHRRVAVSLYGLSENLEAQGDSEGAERAARQALAAYRTLGPDHYETSWSLHTLGTMLYNHGKLGEAEMVLKESLDIRRRTLGSKNALTVATLSNLAKVRVLQGNVAEATQLFSEAAVTYDAVRLQIGVGMARASFQESPYPFLAATQLALGDEQDAWQSTERSRALVLADLLFVADERELGPGERAKESELLSTLEAAERELAALQDQGPSPELIASLERTRNRLFAAQAEWSTFQLALSQKYPVSEGRAFTLDRVQEALASDEAIVGWLDVGWTDEKTESWAYVVRNEGPVHWARLEPQSEGASIHSTKFRAAVQTPGLFTVRPVEQTSRALFSERVAPIAHSLGSARHLIVVSSGPMLGVPVEALIDDEGHFLGDSFVVSYIPSATIYTWLEEKSAARRHSRTGKALLVGDPPFCEEHRIAMEDQTPAAETVGTVAMATARGVLSGNDEAIASLPRLPFTRREVMAISDLTQDATVFVGAEASEQNVRRLAGSGALAEFDVVHLATHALVDSRAAERSALVLSQVDLPDPVEAAKRGDTIYTGLVTVEDILRGWKLSADLVTLSACETGLGEEVSGEGYVGFMHAFLQVGARSLVVSLWKVDDRATALFMRRFYEIYFGSERVSKAEALQKAKIWLRNYKDDSGKVPYAHPAYWSSFILVGDRG